MHLFERMLVNESSTSFISNQINDMFFGELLEVHYYKYMFFAACSALLGLPLNILLLCILTRIGLFHRRHNNNNSKRIKNQRSISTGSFEMFLSQVTFVDTLLILYHFMDHFLSYIHKDRSVGQHYLIHTSDFCCKFFTYFAKMSVLLTTWLLLFLILNQFVLAIKSNENYSCWHDSLYCINAKYSTVFVVFICGLYNIYPIEVLKYQTTEVPQDYQQGKEYKISILIDYFNSTNL